MLASLCMSKMKVNHPILAEMNALWRAMEFCIELNFSNVVFDGDALAVIEAVNSRNEVWIWYGQLIEDLRRVFKRRTDWKLHHMYRESNKLAHEMAKVAIEHKEEFLWIEDGPLDIITLVLHDKLCNDYIVEMQLYMSTSKKQKKRH